MGKNLDTGAIGMDSKLLYVTRILNKCQDCEKGPFPFK
jgi:hypothetical protein